MARKGQLLAYTEEQIEFIKANVKDRSNKDLAVIFNKEFGTQKTEAAIRKIKFRFGLKSGIVHIPVYVDGKPIGSIRNKEGRYFIKTPSGKWVQLHRYIWEQANGPVPKGHVVIFGDGNRLNCDINNLILVSRQQLITMNYGGLIKDDADLTRTGVIIADLVNKLGIRSILYQKENS